MKIELEGDFFIETNTRNVSLKQRYNGVRNGKQTTCEKIVGSFGTVEDALSRFLALFKAHYGKDTTIPIAEYIESLKKANTKAYVSDTGNFYIYVSKGSRTEKEHHSIIDLIPEGRENAIKRKDLVAKCLRLGLVEGKDADRNTRRLIENARIDYTILNLSDGKGYYRPTKDDLQDLQRYIRQGESRARANFKNISMAKALYEDFKAGRL